MMQVFINKGLKTGRGLRNENNIENEFILTMILIIFIILGSIYVRYFNAKDDELIYNRKHNVHCTNTIIKQTYVK
jgi:hypothetical protein